MHEGMPIKKWHLKWNQKVLDIFFEIRTNAVLSDLRRACTTVQHLNKKELWGPKYDTRVLHRQKALLRIAPYHQYNYYKIKLLTD